jgi:hypothetical protein
VNPLAATSRSRPVPGAQAVSGRLVPLCRRLAWRHPEWWSLAASAAAWGLIVARASSAARGPSSPHGHHGTAALSLHSHPSGWWPAALDWLLMIMAMMLPLVVEPIRTAAARSLWARRHRAIAGFLLGYVTPWLLLGALAGGLIAAVGLRQRTSLPVAAAIAFAVAAAWQLTPIKRRALRWCHRTVPLAPSGWRADRDCLHFGWTIGCRCVVSCGALMMACLLGGHGILAMTGVATVGAAERFLPRADPRIWGVAVVGLAAVYAWGALG